MDYTDPEQPWYWNPSAVLNHVRDVATSLDYRVGDFDWLWSDVRNNIIDVVARTIALGLCTSISVAVLYTIISKRWRDWMPIFILFSILPEFLTAFSVWLGFCSRLVQQYSVMRVKLANMHSSVDSIKVCIDSLACSDAYPLSGQRPWYTGHGCVGTALLAADPLLHSAVMVGLAAHWLYLKGRLGLLNSGILLAPLLAAAVSAAKHVDGVCWPEPTAVGSLRVAAQWKVFTPKYPDVTTARLSQLSSVVPLLVQCYYIWQQREVYKASLRDSSIRRHWTRWLAVTYILPLSIGAGWRSLRVTYNRGQRRTNWPVLEFAFFSFGDALVLPLTAMYPGIALFFQRLWYVETEREIEPEAGVESTNEKAGTTAVTPSASSAPVMADKKSNEAASSPAL